jgi:transcriptional regulator with XRE-family HTH domain
MSGELMDDFNVAELQAWREKLVISQKRLAELAKISLTTLRQLEAGSHKPQQRTLKKIFEIMKSIESGDLSMEDVKPRRKRRSDAAELATPAPVMSLAPVVPATPPVATHSSTVHALSGAVAPHSSIQLSNLDLELINRILNLGGREKLALLERML